MLTFKEAEELVVKLDSLLSQESKHNHIRIADVELKHTLIVVVPKDNNKEELRVLGKWVSSGPIYPKETSSS